jgi:hypothetical protein
MGTLLFTTTKLRGLHAAGRTADLQRDLLTAVIERQLGPAYANLFAEFETRDSDTRDWFVDAPPAPVNIRDLPEEHRTLLKARCDMQIGAIRALADRLDGEGANSRNLARALRDATIFPVDDLWLYKGAPLIVNWGFARVDSQAAAPAAISGATVILDAEPPPIVADDPEKRKRRWPAWLSPFLWFVFIALTGTIYAELLPACGLQFQSPFSPVAIGNCPVISLAVDASAEGARLLRQIEQAELDLARQQQTCPSPRKGAARDAPAYFAQTENPNFSPARQNIAAALASEEPRN